MISKKYVVNSIAGKAGIMDYLKGVDFNTTAGKNPQPDSSSPP